jgi:hypothetical protein
VLTDLVLHLLQSKLDEKISTKLHGPDGSKVSPRYEKIPGGALHITSGISSFEEILNSIKMVLKSLNNCLSQRNELIFQDLKSLTYKSMRGILVH